MTRARLAALAGLVLVLAIGLAACSAADPEPTPVPTTYPRAPEEAASAVVDGYLAAWASADYDAMYASLDAATRARVTLDQFRELHATFADLSLLTSMTTSAGAPEVTALLPEARPPEFAAPSPTPVPTTAPSGDPNATPTPQPTPAPSFDPTAPVAGPVPGLAVPVTLDVATDRFGEVDLERRMTLVEDRDGWAIRWSPELLFPELGDAGSFRLDRSMGDRGSILGGDGLVWAQTRDDGIRVYPQEWLAGQVIGYVSEVTAEDLDRLGPASGYRAGDVIGRSGLEAGAEDLLRGIPGWTLVAIGENGVETPVLQTEMVPGADIAITIRPTIQSTAQDALAPYGAAATAVIDPNSGDVWALASTPAFNPNAMTLGTTLDGQPLNPAGQGQVFNKAVLGAYPAGSSFKPFTLAVALKTGVVTPQSLVTCPPTWQYGSFTFRNYEEHSLPGLVSLAQAMAFSCNTTYMPLALSVYQADETALTDLLKEFGFGQASGIGYLVEETGIVPDDQWLSENGRGGYSGFEQVQLAIGQGAFLGTPLQLANAYATIGNGGTLWRPRILTTATLPDGTVVESVEPEPIRQVSVSREDLAYVTDTLQAVVTLPYGTGTAAFAGFGVPVAGKSGTAETGTPDPHAWFPAYAPADAPTISVATILTYIPLGTGGSDAAPLVRRVMAAHFAGG